MNALRYFAEFVVLSAFLLSLFALAVVVDALMVAP